MAVTTISPQALHDRLQSGGTADVLDVRTPLEFRELHARGARLLPLDRLDPAAVMAARGGRSDEPLYVLCKSGNRGRQACERFLAAGYANVVSVEGGTDAWAKAGLPVVRGRKGMSLERQVRLAAGLLVLLGSALGFFVHPYFIGLAAFVGAGLAFSGLTDTCGMALLLARMPWNSPRIPAADLWPTTDDAANSETVALHCGR